MEFLIYTIGNFDWARQVFLGLSMAFDPSTGDFGQPNYLFGLGLVLSFFVAAFKQFFEKGQIGGEFLGTVCKGYLIWMLCFYPRVDIVVEHAGTGDSAYFTDIPVGLAIGGAVTTQVPIAFIDILSDIFVMPQNSGTHLDALRTLVAIEGSVNSPNIRTIGHADSDFIRSIDSYMNGCLFKDMEVGGAYQEAKVGNVLTNVDAWAAMEVSSTIWYIDMYLEGQPSFMSCKDAYTALSAYIDNDQSKLADGLDELNEAKGISATQVSSALQQLGSASMDSYTFQMNNFLDYHVKKNAMGLDASHSARGQLVDAMEYQAKQQRLFTMAGDRNLWLEMAPATISFFEAFVWFAAPLMSFFIIFGEGGFKIAASYMRFLVLVGLYPFVMILINFYLDWSIQNALETSISEQTAYTIGGLSNFYSEARSYIATASYMTTMVPMLAYMLLKGGEYATVSMAGKIGGTAHVNPSAVAPDIAVGAKNGSLRMGNHSWTMGDNGVVHSTNQIQDQNMPTLGGMSNMTSNLSLTSSMAESRVQSAQATHQQSWGQLSQLMTQIQKGKSANGSDSHQYSENAQFASQVREGLQKNTNLDTQEITQLMGKLVMGGGGSASGNLGWGNGEDSTQQTSENAKTSTQASDSTQYTNGESNKTMSNTQGGSQTDGRYGRGRVTKTSQIEDKGNSKAERVQVTDTKSNEKSSGKTDRVSSRNKSDFAVGLDGRVQVNAEGGFNLTEREAEALQASLGYVTSEQGGTGAQYTSQEAIQKVHGLSRTTGWGETGQNAIQDLKSYTAAKQFQETTQHALCVAKGLNQNYSTNFTNAANNKEFKEWVANGYNTESEMANMSPEERRVVEANAQARNLQIQRDASKYYHGDVGRAAAVLFSSEMVNQYQEVANAKDMNSMKSGLMDISQKFNEADFLIGDKALNDMSKNFATMSNNLGSVKDTTSNSAVAGIPEEIQRHQQGFEKTRDERLGEVGTLLTTKNIKDEHEENVVKARANASKVAPEKTDEIKAIETATDTVNPTPISQEVKSAAKDAGGLVNDVAAGLVAQFHSATAQQLSEPAAENMKHLESPLNKGADLLTRPQIATNPSARDFGLTTNSEGVYGAAVIALTSDENTLNKDGLLSDTEIKHHNNAVGNIEKLRSEMSEDESFAKEVGGLASGKYTMEALEDYKLFMGGSEDGFRDIDYNNVAHVASTLGTSLTDEQVSNLSNQSEVNKNYDVVNGKLLSKHYLQIGTEDGAEHQKAYHAVKDTPNEVKLSQLEATGKEQNEAAIKEGQSNGTTPLTGVNDTVANTAMPGSVPSNEPSPVPSSMTKFAETAAQSLALMEVSENSGMSDEQKLQIFDSIDSNTISVKEGAQLFNAVSSGEMTANQAITSLQEKEEILASTENTQPYAQPTEVYNSKETTTQPTQGNDQTGFSKLASMVVSALSSNPLPQEDSNNQSTQVQSNQEVAPDNKSAETVDTSKTSDTVATNSRPDSSAPQSVAQTGTVAPATQVASVSPQKVDETVPTNSRSESSAPQSVAQTGTVAPATQVTSASPQKVDETAPTNSRPESSAPQSVAQTGTATQVANASPQKVDETVPTNSRTELSVPTNSRTESSVAQSGNVESVTQLANAPTDSNNGDQGAGTIEDSQNDYKMGNQTKLASLNDSDPSSPSVTRSGSMDLALLESSQFSGMADGEKEIVMEAIASGQLTADEGIEVFNAVQSGEINSDEAIQIANGTKELPSARNEMLASTGSSQSNSDLTASSDSDMESARTGADNEFIAKESDAQLASTNIEAPVSGAVEQPSAEQFEAQVAMDTPNQFDTSVAPSDGGEMNSTMREGEQHLASTSFESPVSGAEEQQSTELWGTQVAMDTPNQFDTSVAPSDGAEHDSMMRENGAQLASTGFDAPSDGDMDPSTSDANLGDNSNKLDIATALTTGDKTNLEMDADEIINGDKLDTIVGLGGSVGEIDGDVNYDQETKYT
ncbi:conjugal transfer protein TraG N-terminal domain-containing protein [Vibrio rotiferianus]|uniref:conjugal transfer protein TraG N-terminal domain-containing protein n=1 Tax=Vibrio rotiferianus TaxID=190895 RepID=UPI00406A5343